MTGPGAPEIRPGDSDLQDRLMRLVVAWTSWIDTLEPPLRRTAIAGLRAWLAEQDEP